MKKKSSTTNEQKIGEEINPEGNIAVARRLQEEGGSIYNEIAAILIGDAGIIAEGKGLSFNPSSQMMAVVSSQRLEVVAGALQRVKKHDPEAAHEVTEINKEFMRDLQ